ncbi:hypothetical protein BDV12DRAFT_20581 [Aspergillus spectabilis]
MQILTYPLFHHLLPLISLSIAYLLFMSNPHPADEVLEIRDGEPRMLVFGRSQQPRGMTCEVFPGSFVVAIISPFAGILVPIARAVDLVANVEALTFYLRRQIRPNFPETRPVMIAVASRCVEERMPDYVAAMRSVLSQCHFAKVVQWFEVSSAVVAPSHSVIMTLTQDEDVPACTIRGSPFPISVYCGDEPLWLREPPRTGASNFRIPPRRVESHQFRRPSPPCSCSSNCSVPQDEEADEQELDEQELDEQESDEQKSDEQEHPTDACEPTSPPSPPPDPVDDTFPNGSAVPTSAELIDLLCTPELEEASAARSDNLPVTEHSTQPVESFATTLETNPDPALFNANPPSSPRPSPVELPDSTAGFLSDPWRFSIFGR